MQKEKVYLWAFIILLAFSALMIFIENDFFTGQVSQDSTISEVTISQYFSISLSSSLSSGIDFGTQNSTAATNLNATDNYNGSSQTEYFITVSSDSNTPVDFTIWADGPLNTSDSDEIGLGNESYHNSTTNTIGSPAVGSAVDLTTSPVPAGDNIAAGSKVFYRFWLDIPAATPVGTYNNTINFQGAAS